MIVNIFDQQSALKVSHPRLEEAVKTVLAEEGWVCDEVTIHLVKTSKISKLHQKFFNDPSSTDCISFPMDDQGEPYSILGEVFICPETAIQYAEEHHKDPYEEVTLYLVHGLLHLMGYDDLNPEDRKEMRKGEARHMKNLKKHHLLLSP